MKRFEINVFSHGLHIRVFYVDERNILMGYAKELAVWDNVWSPKMRRKVNRIKAIFATASSDRKEFGFLRYELPAILDYLKRQKYTDKDIQINYHQPDIGDPVDLQLLEGVGPRDEEQVDVMEFITGNPEHLNRVLPLRTGGGKTSISLMAAAHFKVRTGLIMGAQHIKTWTDSVGWVLGLTKDDFCIVRGRKALETVVEMALAGEKPYKLIFFSIATLREFLKDHLETNYHINGVTPNTLMATLGIGLRIIDESHQNIHALVRDTIHTHVARTLYLSATLISEDDFINSQYEKIFPLLDRFNNGESNKHADGISIQYYLEDVESANYEGAKGYSHLAYEAWLMESVGRLYDYYKLIKILVDKYYIDVKEPGQKIIIFCSSIEMCKAMAELFIEGYSDTDLTISDYVGFHDPSVLYENDIVISTPTSAGTGKDIKGLITCISTTAVGSVQLNRQMLGRLREDKQRPDLALTYLWLTCIDIPQHAKYDKMKLTVQFPNHTRSLKSINSGITI